MLLIAKKVFFLVGLTLYIISAHSQTVTSTRNGVWSDPATWSSGIVPTSVNATVVVIEHEVELPSLYVVSVFNLLINNKLTLKTSSQLDILPDALPTPDLSIVGTLVKEEGSILNGTSITNTTFASGSTYIHQQGPLGFIPYATWHSASTFIINGFRDSGYINIAHSDSWKQTFGNVIYDCPQQSIFVVDLNGYLRNITGDFIIKSTNYKTLRLSTTQNPLINIGGSLIVEGPSELWFSTNGATTVVNIKKDFKYASTSAGPSYLTTRGMISINVSGSLEWNSPGPLRMASSSADSLGLRRAVVNLHGNLSVGPGVIIAPPFTHLQMAVATVNGTPIEIAAQNCHYEPAGAYTGEISVDMLKGLGVSYIITGHSERRQLFMETNAIIRKKVDSILGAGLTPIFCCGESLDIRESEGQNEFVAKQLEESLFHLEIASFEKVVIAYEPIWAIGTGVTASPMQAQEMHSFIRKTVASRYNDNVSNQMRILYGGSIKADNAATLFSQEDVDGGLVGGASLHTAGFLTIIDAAC